MRDHALVFSGRREGLASPYPAVCPFSHQYLNAASMLFRCESGLYLNP